MANNLPKFIHDYGAGLFLIDLDLPREGFRRFISSWIYLLDKRAILVDCGPAATYETLKSALSFLAVEKLDYILITHIHLDHAGALGLLVKDYPAPVICHPAGIPHLVSPGKLEEASRRVLGDLALAYGPVIPTPAEMFVSLFKVKVGGITICALDTPGHAPHHLCFLLNDFLFGGEICGVSYPLEGGYLRPTTPPPFRYGDYRESLNKVIALSARLLCFGHYGAYQNPGDLLEAATRQLDRWVQTIKRDGGKRDWGEYFEELLSIDPLISNFFRLPQDVQVREKFFIANSIKGIADST